MNIETVSIEALRVAREITPEKGDYRKQLEATFKMASALAESFSIGSFSSAIDCLPDLFQKSENVSAVPNKLQTGGSIKPLALHSSDDTSSTPNQTLAGQRFDTHKYYSSQKENNCGPELPTPGHNETVDPSSGTVTDQGTHGRTAGGVRQ